MIKTLEQNGLIEKAPARPDPFVSLYNQSTCRDWNKAGASLFGRTDGSCTDAFLRKGLVLSEKTQLTIGKEFATGSRGV